MSAFHSLNPNQFVPGEHRQTSGQPTSASTVPHPDLKSARELGLSPGTPEWDSWHKKYSENHQAHFRSTRLSQYDEMVGHVEKSVAKARDARQRGDRPSAARFLNEAARGRRTVEAWKHLKS